MQNNPQTFDPRIKNHVTNQNIYNSSQGNYVCPISDSIKFSYKNDYNPGPIDNVCKVIVSYKHSLDVANSLTEDFGYDALLYRKPIPVIIYPMGKEFTGTNFESREGIYDEVLILRTNYAYVIKKQFDLFTFRENEKDVVYSNPITAIRDDNYVPLSRDKLYKFGVITMCCDTKYDHITERITDGDTYNDTNVLKANDILQFQIQLEASIQVAICGFHNILILPVFGREFNIPIDEQILVFNLCIMKYGHKFKGIMVCIPPYFDKEIFDIFDSKIIKPQIITSGIETKYKSLSISNRLVSSKQKTVDNNDNNDNSDKIKMLRKLIKQNKKA